MASETEQTRIVKRLVAQHPDAPARTLAKRLHHEHPAMFPSVDRARTAVRYQLGTQGNANRRKAVDKSGFRPNRKAGELPPLPASDNVPWEPFALEASKTLIVSDIHLPWQDNTAIEAALKYGDKYQPDAVLINGDLFDFYQLSRFDRCPTIAKVEDELKKGREFFAHLRARFKRADLYLKFGNHDERWASYIFRAAPLLALQAVLDCWMEPAGIHEFGVTVIRDQRPIMLGKLPVFHGHELGKSIFSPVNPARGAFLRAHHTILVGHSHQTSGHADTNVWHEETFCWSTGCLCGLSPEYARINRWNHGLAAVDVHQGGEFDVTNLRIAGGVVRKS